MKEMTSVATTLMTEEGGEKQDQAPSVSSSSTPPAVDAASELPTASSSSDEKHARAQRRHSHPESVSVESSDHHPHRLPMVAHSTETDPLSKTPSSKEKDRDVGKKRARMTPEQRKKLEELEKERRKAMEERVATLTTKLAERLRPYVEAQRPGDKSDPETLAFETKMRREAEDLKLESFGVEVR